MSFVGMGVPCLTQLPEHARIVMRRLFVGVEDFDTRFEEKPPQGRLVLRTFGAERKPSAQFGQHDKWQPDFIG